MITKRRIGCFLLCFLLLFTMCPHAFAAQSDVHKTTLDNYAETVIWEYLSNEIYTDLFISQPFVVDGGNDENARIYVVSDGKKHIGTLSATTYNGYYYSSFADTENEDISTAMAENMPVTFATSDNALLVETAADSQRINNGTLTTASDNSAEPIALHRVETLPATNTSPTSREVLRGYLNGVVDRVANESLNNIGLCWSAACAMIINYRTSYSYNALSLYHYLNQNYSGTPEGTNTWYMRAFLSNGLAVQNIVGGMIGLNLCDALLNDKPVLFYIATSDDAYSHAIVLVEYYQNGSNVSLKFRDPNAEGYVTLSSNETTYSDPEDFSKFCYTLYGNTYSKVYRVYY